MRQTVSQIRSVIVIIIVIPYSSHKQGKPHTKAQEYKARQTLSVQLEEAPQ